MRKEDLDKIESKSKTNKKKEKGGGVELTWPPPRALAPRTSSLRPCSSIGSSSQLEKACLSHVLDEAIRQKGAKRSKKAITNKLVCYLGIMEIGFSKPKSVWARKDLVSFSNKKQVAFRGPSSLYSRAQVY